MASRPFILVSVHDSLSYWSTFQSDPNLSVGFDPMERNATSPWIKGERNASDDWFAQGKSSSDLYKRGFKRQIHSQAFQIQQKGVWMFAHSWRANIHPQGRSRPAQLQDGLKRAWWVAIKLRNLPAKSVKNVDSRTGKQMQVLEIPMYLFSFYSFTGILLTATLPEMVCWA